MGNLVVGRGPSTAGVWSHPEFTCGMRSDESRCFSHNSLVYSPNTNDQSGWHLGDARLVIYHGLRLFSP